MQYPVMKTNGTCIATLDGKSFGADGVEQTATSYSTMTTFKFDSSGFTAKYNFNGI